MTARNLGRVLVGLLVLALGACSANGSGGSNSDVGGLNASTHIKAAPLVTLSLSPTHIDAGGNVTVTWSSAQATTCTGTGALAGAQALDQVTGLTMALDKVGTWTFGIECHGAGGSASDSATVSVGVTPPPVIEIFSFPPVIKPTDNVNLVWDTDYTDTCVASGGSGSDGWGGNIALNDIEGFATAPINALGDYTYTITCMGPGGTTSASRIVSVTNAAPDAPPTMTIGLSPNQIAPGESAALSWSTSNATTCGAGGGTGNDGWIGLEPTASTSTSTGPISTPGTYVYTLGCLGKGGSVAKSVMLLVIAPTANTPVPQVAINVSPATIEAGSAAYLTWSTSNAESCVATGSWGGGKPLLGNAVSTGNLALPGLYTYTLTCTGPSGSATATADLTVNVGIPSVSIFTASPPTVSVGGNVTLSWASTEATSCSASGGTGTDGWSGAEPPVSAGLSVGPLNVAGTYTYTLICVGPGGPSAPQSVNVTVASGSPGTPTVTAFIATPTTVTAGQAAVLSWNSSNATSCTGTGGTGTDGWHGSVGTSSIGTSTGALLVPGTFTYTLTCTGPGGTSIPASTIVNVNALPVSAPAVVATFTATPSNLQITQSTTLAWTSIGATSCNASGGTGSDNWGGTVNAAGTASTGAINSANTYTYTLTCTGPGGTGTPTSVTVNVNNPPGATAAIATFSATPTTVLAGGSTLLAWTTSNATSCTPTGGTGTDGWAGGLSASSIGTPVGPLNAAGTVTYTLTCDGPGGMGSPSSVSVNVLNAIPLPALSAFTATPATIQTGQSTNLSWTTVGATSCAATGGSPSDGWVGARTATGTVNVGPINTAGTYTYTLTCTGPGGTGVPSSAVVNVNAVTPPAASVTALIATPSTLLTGLSSVLTWTSDSASACTASGGLGGSDGWTGSVGTSSLGTTVGPFTTAGTYTYTLTCMGAGGTGLPQSVAINVSAAPTPPVVGVFTVLPTTVTTGSPVTINWVTLGATSCTASGGTGTDNWGGTVATSNVGVTTAPLTPAGTYTYTLTCSGAGGSSSPNSVSVSVTDAPTPPAIQLFLATPAAVQTGGSTLFTWTALGATSCAGTGGTGTDGWAGPHTTTSLGTTIGPITPAGTYTYTLACTGAGGTTSSTQTVTVTDATPPASVVSFTALPNSISTGQSVLLNWVTAGATACTASGGTGSDGWHGSKPTTGLATTVGPINSVGVYAYTLNCTGPGGASAPSSVTVTVNAATPPASVIALTAAPSTVLVGQSSTLAWVTSNATSCTATGGTGSDHWNGTVGATGLGTAIGPFPTVGSVTYTLTCTGPGGTGASSSTSVAVNAAAIVQPTVSLMVNGSTSATVQPGAAPTLSWSSTNASACVATGGTGTDGWAGVKATSSTGFALSAISTPGTYSYSLSCTGAGGSSTGTVQVTVIASATTNCGLASVPTTALLTPSASVTSSTNGLLCIGCSVSNPTYVIATSPPGPASLNVVAGLLNGTAVLRVKDGSTSYPAGRQVGFDIDEGNTTLSLSALQSVQVSTYLAGTVQETATTNNHLLGLQALSLVSLSPNAGFVGFTTTKPFNEVGVQLSGVASVLGVVNVYRACVSLN